MSAAMDDEVLPMNATRAIVEAMHAAITQEYQKHTSTLYARIKDQEEQIARLRKANTILHQQYNHNRTINHNEETTDMAKPVANSQQTQPAVPVSAFIRQHGRGEILSSSLHQRKGTEKTLKVGRDNDVKFCVVKSCSEMRVSSHGSLDVDPQGAKTNVVRKIAMGGLGGGMTVIDDVNKKDLERHILETSFIYSAGGLFGVFWLLIVVVKSNPWIFDSLYR
eukprot:CFRG2869T1